MNKFLVSFLIYFTISVHIVSCSISAIELPSAPMNPAEASNSCIEQAVIAFVSNRDGNDEIYSLDAGRNLKRLTFDAASDNFPRWSPDGRYISFVSYRDGNAEIYLMDANGENQTRLTNDPSIDIKPAWSADSQYIVFASNRSGYFNIYKIKIEGRQLSQLTNEDSNDSDPSWSPDGKRIIFISDRDSAKDVLLRTTELYMMNSDGSEQTRITNVSARSTSPIWSPDGKKIAFASDKDSKRGHISRIYILDLDSNVIDRVTYSTLDYSEFAPAWSPNGKCIIFTLDSGKPQIYYTIVGTYQTFQLITSDFWDSFPDSSVAS